MANQRDSPLHPSRANKTLFACRLSKLRNFELPRPGPFLVPAFANSNRGIFETGLEMARAKGGLHPESPKYGETAVLTNLSDTTFCVSCRRWQLQYTIFNGRIRTYTDREVYIKP